MVVNHSTCLHMGVNGGGAYELEAPLFQIAADHIRKWRAGGKLGQYLPRILNAFSVGKIPEVGTEVSMILPDTDKALCIVYGRFNLLAMADNPRVLH